MKYATKSIAGHEADTKVDLTPMLDMVFILIIFFIVSASFTHEPGVSINRPLTNPDTAQEPSETPIFAIHSNDTVYHQSYDLEISAISAIAKRIYIEDPEQKVILRLHDNASHGTFIEVYDQLRLGGFDVKQIPIISFSDQR